MKMRLWIIFPILLAFLFTGCACEHEWVEADCVNPQTCAKCNESGEPALGHDWSEATCTDPETCTRCSAAQGIALGHEWLDATCTAPQTCSRCAEVQGDPLAHTYGEWEFSGEEMTHRCILCNQPETQPIDHELYLEQILSGHWNMHKVYYDNTSYTAQDLIQHNPKSNCAITFGPDKSCRITMGIVGVDTFNSAWKYKTHSKGSTEVTTAVIYFISVPHEDIEMNFVLVCFDNGAAVLLFYASNAEIWFMKDSATE